MNSQIFFTTAILCIAVFKTGHAGYQCHQCASKDDGSVPPFCTDPYNAELMDALDDCDDRDTHCLKSKVVTKLNDAGFITGQPRESVVVTRGCIRADGEPDGCRYFEADSAFFIWCICSGNGCNSAHGVISSLTFTLLTVAIATIFNSL